LTHVESFTKSEASTPLKPWIKCSRKISEDAFYPILGEDRFQVNFQLTILNVMSNVIEQ